jgi:hypothetical protein
MQTCQAKTKTGAACRAPATAGGLCYLHANPNKAKTLGQIGGRKNRRSPVDLDVPDNMTPADLAKLTGQAMRKLFTGELGAREVSAFAQLCNCFYRISPAADLETRIATLERQIAEEGQQPEGGIALDSDSTGSPTDQFEAAETNESVEAEQEGPCAVATMEDEEEAQGTSDGSNESEEP